MGSALIGKGQSHRGESDVVEGGEVGIAAKEVMPALSPRRGVFAFSVQVRSKNMSPSRVGGNGPQNNVPSSEVSPPKWSPIPCIPEPYTPTKLLVFNVHGTLLDTGLLSQPNPNPNIQVTKKNNDSSLCVQTMDDRVFGKVFQNIQSRLLGIKEWKVYGRGPT